MPGAALSPNPANSVFISYASQDGAVADALCAALERGGVACWIAPRNVRPGDFYADAIVNAINACPVLVLVLSKNSVDSAHVLREVERASAKRRPVIAFRIDAAPLPAALEYFLSASQWIDASAASPERGFPKLAEALRGRISTAPKAESVRPTRRPPNKTSLNRTVVAVTALIAAALVCVIAERFWLSKHVAAVQPTTAGTDVVTDKSIAVLPFADMSEKKDQEYFADGMAEEIIDRMAKVPGLKVVGRASSFQFNGKGADTTAVRAALGVSYLLEGSVRRSGEHIRVTAQLIDTKDGGHRWSNTYDAKTDDVFEVQDAIAVGISRALEVTMTAEVAQDRSVAGRDAYDLYLRGLHALDSGSKDGCEQAIELFNQLLHVQPHSERALISLAWAHDCIGWGGWLVPGAGLPQAREVATRALQADPQSAEAHLVLADVYMELDYDWTSAQREIDAAFKLASPDARALRTAARLAGALGHFDRSLEVLTQALALDPLDPELYDQLGDTYARAGKFERAEEMYRHCLQIAPNFISEHFYISNALLLQSRFHEALAEADREQEDSARFAGRALALYALHQQHESDAELRKFIEVTGLEWASEVARVYAFRGEREQALRWLDKAFQQRDPDLYFIKGDPLLKNLEGDPRYKAFLRKMNLPD